MGKKIAVHVGASGETADFNQAGMLRLYERQQGVWQISWEHCFALQQDKGLHGMRQQMAELISSLGECKILVASTISGVPYYELERAGLSLWEYNGNPADFLDQIVQQEEETVKETRKPVVVPVAKEIENGCFQISIKEIQEADSGVTSKQILLPLLQKTVWYRLEVICNHIPPWLEGEAMLKGYRYEIHKRGPADMRLLLQKKVCGEE